MGDDSLLERIIAAAGAPAFEEYTERLPAHVAQSDRTLDAVSVTATLRAPEFEE